MQRTITLAHLERHDIGHDEIKAGLQDALAEEGLKLVGDYKIKSSTNVSGQYTRFVFEVEAEEAEPSAQPELLEEETLPED